jgi:hypothetical protein
MKSGRRTFLKGLAAVALPPAAFAAAPKPSVTLIVGDRCRAGRLHAPADCVTFTRAFTACPERGRGLRSILSGVYPHAETEGDTPTLSAILDDGGVPCEVIDLTRQQTYSGSVAALEAAMERATAAQEANRIVVITAARGAMLGAHGDDNDDTWFEEAVRVPLVLRWPGRVRGSSVDFLCSTVDIVPTVLGLCGVAHPDELQGRDLSPFLLGRPAKRPEWIYGEGGFATEWEWRMLVRGLDKAVFDVDGQLEHLYNLGEDPSEDHDLASGAAQERRRDELTALFEDVRRRLGDRMDPSGLRRRR